jgi:hypothetical protein
VKVTLLYVDEERRDNEMWNQVVSNSEYYNRDQQCRYTEQTAAGCLAGLIPALLRPAAVVYSCRSEQSFASIFEVSKIGLEGRLSVPELKVASHYFFLSFYFCLLLSFSLLHYV